MENFWIFKRPVVYEDPKLLDDEGLGLGLKY